jgi:hypothetical protein
MRMARLMAGTALAGFLLTVPASSLAAETNAQLEARVRELEAALASVKAEMAANREAARAEAVRGEQRIVQLEARPAAPAAPPAPPPSEPGFRVGNTLVSFGGYVKLDAMVSDFGRADPPGGDLLRDFYLPGAIPVTGADEDAKVDLNARQTRLWFTTSSTVGGHKVASRVEGDFQVLPGSGDARTTNPANFSLRRAYVTVDNWLFGQEWSNFQNIAVLPETADYIGPTEGTVFVRQAQVRYTHGPFSMSVENPETTVTPFGGGVRILADDAGLPDFTARFDLKRPFGEFALTGLVRQLALHQGAIDDKATGWGVSASGKIKVGSKNDLRLMVTTGEGIGRYVGLNFANDAVLDAGGDLKPIPLTAGFVAYRHFWTDTVRSTFMYSAQVVDNPRTLTGLAANESASSLHGNLVWSPFKGFDIGAEYLVGERKVESGADGDLKRLQAFVKYGF